MIRRSQPAAASLNSSAPRLAFVSTTTRSNSRVRRAAWYKGTTSKGSEPLTAQPQTLRFGSESTKHSRSFFLQVSGNMDGCCGLAHAALMCGHSNDHDREYKRSLNLWRWESPDFQTVRSLKHFFEGRVWGLLSRLLAAGDTVSFDKNL